MKTGAILLALATAAQAAVTDHWAVIVAGSKGYSNYRHQADTAHAWQIMRANGIPESNIIHMAYDDIANNRQNPYPGQLFNQPDGKNVYEQSSIDYSDSSVTPENFINILTGEATTGGNGKTLKSTSSSNVFVYFADHGAPGLIAFPHKYLYADTLNDAINTMHSKNMYNKLVFYIEACESGSMFPDLKSNINVAAMTASNATQSSYASYCWPNNKVDGVSIGSCLGDLFSTNWMEDTQANDPDTETLITQHTTVKELTTASPVELFGDLTFGSEFVGEFQGSDNGNDSMSRTVRQMIQSHVKPSAEKGTLVDSRDTTLHDLYAKAHTLGDKASLEALQDEISHRLHIDTVFESVYSGINGDFEDLQPRDFDCLRMSVDNAESACGKFTDYSLKHIKYLAYACENYSALAVQRLNSSLHAVCQAN